MTAASRPASELANALSVDVEEYFHAEVYREAVGPAPRGAGAPPSRVERAVDRVLELLRRHAARATFFTLGEIAESHPALVRRIHGEGHEVACHGHAHDCVFRQTAAEFRDDVRRAKAALEDAIGERVIGYRAPSYSIGAGERWAYDVLADEGFRYDSSLYPILHDRYGDPRGARFPHALEAPSGRTLVEFPIGTLRLLGVNLPIGGGGWFRLLPERLVRSAIRRVNRRERRPVMFFFHPWELDAALPRPAMRRRQRFRLYVGIAREERKLDRLFAGVRFTTAREVLGLAPAAPGG